MDSGSLEAGKMAPPSEELGNVGQELPGGLFSGLPGKAQALQSWVHGRGHSLPTGPARPWSAGQPTRGEWMGTPASPSPSNTQEAPLCTGPARVPGWQRPALSPGRVEGTWGRVLGPWNH